VSNTLLALESANMGEGNQDIAVSVVGSLTGDPDMIDEKAAETALNVLSANTNDPISADTAGSAVASVSNIFEASTSHTNKDKAGSNSAEDDAAARKKQKAKAKKIVSIISTVLDNVTVTTGEGSDFVMQTPLIEARKSLLVAGQDFNGETEDQTGIQMGGEELAK